MKFERWPGDIGLRVSGEMKIEIDGVEYHRHENGGGLVAATATVHASDFVGFFAQVSDNAKVRGNAQVSGNAQVFGDAQVFGGMVSDGKICF